MAWTPEQEKAINEKGTNIIVSAGAGSGKTAVLTARTMRILKEGVHVNELLILTFTKAAAGEMKERIRKSIKKEVEQIPSLKKELELIDQAYITTFDSFALSVVKKYHYLLNISNNIAITDASIIEMQKVKIMDEVFDLFYENAETEPEFTKLIYDFCTKDDKDIKNAILKIATKIDGLPNREEYISTYMENFASTSFFHACLEEYESFLLGKIAEIKNLSEKLSFLTDGTFTEKIDMALGVLLQAKTINTIRSEVNLVSLPVLRGAEEEVKECKTELKKSLDELKEITNTYGTKEEIEENIKQTTIYVSVMLKIIKEYLQRLHAYKKENEIYDFQDIALLSIQIVKEHESVREELKNTFKEIMIDEYQDTNDIQETFIQMIENHNVYMVGDIKQSIYRFRNANPYIFKAKYDSYAQNQNGLKIDLVKNFRSRREVLSNINEVFNLIMDNAIGGAEYHESHQMVYGNTSYIEEGNTEYNYNFQILEYQVPEETKFSKEEIEIFTIARDIEKKVKEKFQVFNKEEKVLRDITYNDFVILMDRTTDFELYKKVFEYLHIPLTLYKDDKLNNSDDIYILKNIIDFIIKLNSKEFDSIFKYDFISIARSYLYNIPDADIFSCFKNNNFKENAIYETLYPISKELMHSTIAEIVEQIIEKTNMYEKLITVGNIDGAQIRISKLIDIADNLSSLGYDIYTFRDYLNELLEANYDMSYSIPNTGANSVKIMTIHKSKGLEYHICYYSGLYKSFNISDLRERFLYDTRYGIITPIFKEGIQESFMKYLVKQHYLEEEVSEKIRLFYVALTRAKEQMILITPKEDEISVDKQKNHTVDILKRRKYRSFSEILHSIKKDIASYYEEIDINALALTKDYLFTNKTLEKINSMQEDFQVEELPLLDIVEKENTHFSKTTHELLDASTKKNIAFGLEMHAVLEYIDFTHPDYASIENPFIANKVKKFLELPIFNDIDTLTIYKEYEFIYEEENNQYHGIIDLMLESQETISIIDYKLNNITDENYINQLTGYKKYIESISNKKVKIYLYSILSETLEEL